jgi:bifunctional enzyme CysN/CysC
MVYWITGRPRSGKTTLAYEKARALKYLGGGTSVLVLDGDEVRDVFPTGFSDEDRYNHIMRVAKIASIAESQGITVIIALVSPKAKWRIEARKLLKESKLIYLSGGTLWAGTEYEEPMEEEFG